jgi:hypothetical protein
MLICALKTHFFCKQRKNILKNTNDTKIGGTLDLTQIKD